jgi:Polysaccharide biosynthesis
VAPTYNHIIPDIPPMVESAVVKRKGCGLDGCVGITDPPSMEDVVSWFPALQSGLHFSQAEFLAIAEDIITRRPCNVLVFGAGYDSATWAALNAGGRTTFLEPGSVWLNMVRDFCHTCDLQFVEYQLSKAPPLSLSDARSERVYPKFYNGLKDVGGSDCAFCVSAKLSTVCLVVSCRRC